MITVHMKASNGGVCKCKFVNYDFLNLALFSLYWATSEGGEKYKVITAKQFRKLKGKRKLVTGTVHTEGFFGGLFSETYE